MKTLLAALVLSAVSARAEAACNRPVDPKKVVLMISFHDGAAEERGAAEAACARGERLVVLPKPSPEAQQVRSQYDAIMRRLVSLETAYERCSTEDCLNQITTQTHSIYGEAGPLGSRLEELRPDYLSQLQSFIESSRANSTKVSSMIISGHDGGGDYYGDYGSTNIAEISEMVSQNQGAFADTSTLLLMGCWTSPPDQVDQYRSIFPKLRVLGGFVGSAPASTREAAGTYVSGLLRGEKNLPRNNSRASVQAMINSVQNMNIVTSGVYINPACEETETSPAYYYISPANNSHEIPEGMRPGINVYQGQSTRDLACVRAFGGGDTGGSFDWNAILQYYQGEREPENNPELRGLYSFLRNNSHCFENEVSFAPVTPDQVLFLRFYQDTKKNFEKYFKAELETMYGTLEKLVEQSTNPQIKAEFQRHQKLLAPGLISMTRSQTLEQISGLQGIYDKIYSQKEQRDAADEQVQRTFESIDKHLYRLKCMPPTWHEYSEGESLAAPNC